jgi:hypothetical protein
MPLTAPPTAPSTADPSTFSTRMDATLAWLATNVTEMNAFQAALTALAAGGAMAIPYTFSATTTDADPGAGFLRLDNATQNLATTIRADLVGSDGSTWTDVLDTFEDSTSTIKGHIMLQKLADATKWIVFSVSALASPSGYKNITAAVVASSSASPFADGDSIVLKFSRNGDKGDTGIVTATPYLKVREEQAVANAGGSSAGTSYQDRVLNTVVANSITGASLASNLITLPAGTYEIFARAPAYATQGHRATLYNNTDSSFIIYGGNAFDVATSLVQTDSFVTGRFTLAAQKDVKIRHWTRTAQASNGLGRNNSIGAEVEVYTEVEIWKVA